MFSASGFWDYSLKVYASTEVKDLCLDLQNRYGFNVNLLLLCGYLERKSLGLSSVGIDKLQQDIAQIDRQIQLIRNKRIAAKKSEPEQYQQLLKNELDLEKQQQQHLIDSLTTITFVRQTLSNLHTYRNQMPDRQVEELNNMITKLEELTTQFEMENDDR